MPVRLADAAERLYRFISAKFVGSDGGVTGPDLSVGLNRRIWRFVKSYTRFLHWSDRVYYLQCQAYWISANLRLARVTGDERYIRDADLCAHEILRRQDPDGAWRLSETEWKGRVATVEGCFGSLALLWRAARTGEGQYLDGARRWYDFMLEKIGFQQFGDGGIGVNYFAGIPRGIVPNNSTLALWFMAELARVTGEDRYLEHRDGILKFLSHVQLESGEIPYSLPGMGIPGRVHYLCYQYNAFQLLDLIRYYDISGDMAAKPILQHLAHFVSTGLSEEGFAKKDCLSKRPIVFYYTSAVAAALLEATRRRLGDYGAEAEKAYGFLIDHQRKDGGFDFSWGDYGFLSDRRSYPLRLCMILDHLLLASDSRGLP